MTAGDVEIGSSSPDLGEVLAGITNLTSSRANHNFLLVNERFVLVVEGVGLRGIDVVVACVCDAEHGLAGLVASQFGQINRRDDRKGKGVNRQKESFERKNNSFEAGVKF